MKKLVLVVLAVALQSCFGDNREALTAYKGGIIYGKSVIGTSVFYDVYVRHGAEREGVTTVKAFPIDYKYSVGDTIK